MNAEQYESLARLLEYPTTDFSARIDECSARLKDPDPTAFITAARRLDLPALEELYIQTFDFNPKCTLDLGWQLFAEDYNRGLFLAKLRELSRRLGVPETSELPDNLPHVLRLLARMSPGEAGAFADACGVPSVEKTLAAIDEGNPYRPLIACALSRLRELAATRMEESST